jgi:putative polyhydroxyalkanoate system protein
VSDISIKRNHNTTVAEAKKVADKVAAKLEKDYQLRSHWEGDVLNFTRSGVNGRLSVSVTHFQIDVKLGFLMAAFKNPIQGAIEQNLDKMLLKPASEKKAEKKTEKAAEKAPAKKPSKTAR